MSEEQEEQLFKESLDDLKRNAEKIGVPSTWECVNCGSDTGATFFNKRLLKICKNCFPLLVDKLGLADRVKAYFSLWEEVMKLEQEDVKLKWEITKKCIDAEQEGTDILNVIGKELNMKRIVGK